MSRSFITTSRSYYFRREGDFFCVVKDHFILKMKLLLDADRSCQLPIVSFVINRKVGNSVKRNLLKRRLRSIFDELSNSGSLVNCFSYILLVKKEIANLVFSDLRACVVDSIVWSKKHSVISNYLKNKIHS